jgi:hypothetical protein
MVKEISFIKDMIFLEYNRFFQMLKTYYDADNLSIPKNKYF